MVSSLPPASSPKWLLKDKAYSEIKDRIQGATFAPGSFLSERQLALLLGMSKTPIKAALERLEQEGFVSVSPQQGIVVRELSIKEISDQFDLRKSIETFVVKTISGNLDKSHCALLEKNLSLQSKAAEKGIVDRLVELDAEFHCLLCSIFGNRAIEECMMQHRDKMYRVISQVMSQSPGRLSDAVNEHRAIYNAIAQGQPDLAVALVEKHLDFGKQYLLQSKWS